MLEQQLRDDVAAGIGAEQRRDDVAELQDQHSLSGIGLRPAEADHGAHVADCEEGLPGAGRRAADPACRELARRYGGRLPDLSRTNPACHRLLRERVPVVRLRPLILHRPAEYLPHLSEDACPELRSPLVRRARGYRRCLPRRKSFANDRAIEARIVRFDVIRPSSRLRSREVSEKFSDPMKDRPRLVP